MLNPRRDPRLDAVDASFCESDGARTQRQPTMGIVPYGSDCFPISSSGWKSMIRIPPMRAEVGRRSLAADHTCSRLRDVRYRNRDAEEQRNTERQAQSHIYT
jgi:hypothetical protein